MEHKRGPEGDRSFKLGDRLKDPAVVVVLLFLAFGVYSLFSSDITGKLIARPQNECSVAGGAASGVMLLGNAGPFQIAGAAQKQNTCGVPVQRPAGELKQLLLLGTRCEQGADGIISLSLENGNTQRLKSACALPSYDETPHSDKLIKHVCAGNDAQVNLINCDCQNADCANLVACDSDAVCNALPDGTNKGCVDKNNGLGKRCYITAAGAACAQNFADECGQGLVCRGGQCMSEAQALAAPAAPAVVPQQFEPPRDIPQPSSPVEVRVGASLVSTVGRMINPIDPAPGTEVTITLLVNEVGDEGSYIIEETVPAGWEIVESTGFERDGNQLTIGPVIEGLGGTVQDARYTYRVRAPQEPAMASFSGTFRFESMAAPAALIGDTAVRMPGTSPNGGGCSTDSQCVTRHCDLARAGGQCTTILPGGSCEETIECVGGTECLGGVCSEAGAGADNATDGRLGNPCHEDKTCAVGQCSLKNLHCYQPQQQVAVEKKGHGESCADNNECHSTRCTHTTCDFSVAGETCTQENDCLNGLCRNGRCQAGGAGATCRAAAECLAGMTCPDETNMCTLQAAARPGERCRSKEDCGVGMACMDDLCVPAGCQTDANCALGEGKPAMFCLDPATLPAEQRNRVAGKMCAFKQRTGNDCFTNSFCLSNSCVSGKCAEAGAAQPAGAAAGVAGPQLRGPGVPCGSDAECQQGLACILPRFGSQKMCLQPPAPAATPPAPRDECQSGNTCPKGKKNCRKENANAPRTCRASRADDSGFCEVDDDCSHSVCQSNICVASRAVENHESCIGGNEGGYLAQASCVQATSGPCVIDTRADLPEVVWKQDKDHDGTSGCDDADCPSIGGSELLCVALGAVVAPTDQCQSNANCPQQGMVLRVCRRAAQGAPKQCAEFAANNAFCETDNDCGTRFCKAGVCAQRVAGDSCDKQKNQNNICGASLFCDASSKCVAKKANGAVCTQAFECSSSGCKDGKCIAKVICTELNRQGLMPDAHLKASVAFADKYLDKKTINGYHYWAKPLVRVMQRSPKVTMLVAPLGLAWGKYVAYEMGVSKDSSAIGEILVKQGESASREIGVFLETNGLAGEVDEKTMEALAYKHLTGMFVGTEKETTARLKERMPGFFADIKAYAQSQKLYKQKN